MKTRLIIVFTVFMAIGNYCAGQDLMPEKGENGKWGFIDQTGKEVIPCKYDNSRSFSEGLASVELNGKWGFINKTGNEIISLKYDNADSFFDGLAIVTLNDKCGFINKTGKPVIQYKYDEVSSFVNGIAEVSLIKRDFKTFDVKKMWIDKQGNEYASKEEALKAVKNKTNKK
jgi:hypothetical protein